MSLLWGTDIGGLAILGNVHDVTVQNSIIGEGLYHSRMPSSNDCDGNSMGVNVTPMVTGQTPPTRLTFYRNLFTTSDLRMPRLKGVICVDLVNNLIYNWGTHAATGNPRSANLVANWFRRGPRMNTHDWWLPQRSSVAPHLFHTAVFTRGNAGWVQGHRRANPVVYATRTVRRPVGARQSGGHGLQQRADQCRGQAAGGRRVDRRVIYNVRNRVGRFFNGVGYARHTRIGQRCRRSSVDPQVGGSDRMSDPPPTPERVGPTLLSDSAIRRLTMATATR